MPHGASIRPRRQTPAPGYAIQLLGRLSGSKYRDIPSAEQLIRQQKLNTGGREKSTHATGVLRDAHGGSAGAQRRMREWLERARISYPEFSFGAVKDGGRRRVESNSAALPFSGASLHPMIPVSVRCACPGRRMWCWRREGKRDRSPPVSAQPTARGRVEEDGEGRGRKRRRRVGTALGKLHQRRLCQLQTEYQRTGEPPPLLPGTPPSLWRNFHHRSHHQR